MKHGLFFLFGAFGQLFEIVVKRANHLRGQAFVVFQDEEAAALAMKSLHGYRMFGKPMHIEFSRKRSRALEFAKRAVGQP
jgi:U2 small nuclear ribonucleoprotein B''